MPYTVYKTLNKITEEYYIGVHKSNNPNDQYYGSGIRIKRSIKKYGKSNFVKEILHAFETEEEAYAKERDLISSHLNNNLCLNLMEGGVGGFTHINKNRNLYVNPMKIEEYKIKCRESRLKNQTQESIEKHKISAIHNLKKATQSNIGKKRPTHSEFMKTWAKNLWSDSEIKEKIRDKLSTWFEVTSPTGERYETNRLKEFCYSRNLAYSTLWGTSLTNKPPKKGKSKGWICKIL